MRRCGRLPKTILTALPLLLAPFPSAAASTCYGTTASGRLEGACQLPRTGSNFEPYSERGVALGLNRCQPPI